MGSSLRTHPGLDEDISKETLQKSVVYRLSNKVLMFKNLGGIPDVNDFRNNNIKEEFLRLLEKDLLRAIKTTEPRDTLKAWKWLAWI